MRPAAFKRHSILIQSIVHIFSIIWQSEHYHKEVPAVSFLRISEKSRSPSNPSRISLRVSKTDCVSFLLSRQGQWSQLLNLKKYPYMRALHYFINLDELPRVTETVSYVYSENIFLRHTYSKDSQMLKGSKIGDLLNRSLIGLPCNTSGSLALRK